MTQRLTGLVALVAAALIAGGCAASLAYRNGNASMRAGNLDDAVQQYRKAVQADPNNANYRIALEREE